MAWVMKAPEFFDEHHKIEKIRIERCFIYLLQMTEKKLQRAAAFLSFLGLGVSFYIAFVENQGGSPVCLAGGHGCATVAASSYSHLFGINVAVFGIIGYLTLLLCSALRNDIVRIGGYIINLLGWGFSLYLTYLELFVIHAICQWCMASAVLMTLLFIVNTLRFVSYAMSDDQRSSPEP